MSSRRSSSAAKNVPWSAAAPHLSSTTFRWVDRHLPTTFINRREWLCRIQDRTREEVSSNAHQAKPLSDERRKNGAHVRKQTPVDGP